MLGGRNAVKFVRRSTDTSSFSLFDAAHIRLIDGVNYFSVAFKPEEYESIQSLLKEEDFFQTIVREENGTFIVEKTRKDWIQWGKSINKLFNTKLVAGQCQ
jgi:hypothetical protein